MTRNDNIDSELFVSGFTKQMAKDINIEYGMQSDSDSENDGDINEDIENQENDEFFDVPELVEPLENKFEKLQMLQNEEVEKEDQEDSDLDSNFEDASHFETQSIRSTASTIHPDEIKSRIRTQLNSKEKRQQRKKCVAKGEASAATRNRRENIETIKTSAGIWGWE